MTFMCPYCGKSKPEAERTKEHVVPKALGGGIEPTNRLLLDVCGACNWACGRYVDGPFIRSWLNNNHRARNALAYSDLARNPVLPLVYLGYIATLEWEGRICEMWLGPTGDRVYHFHRAYPGASAGQGLVGRPFYAKPDAVDAGVVFLFVQATNPEWHPSIVLSVLGQFDDAVIYFGNSNVPKGGHPRLKEVPPGLSPLHEKLRALNGIEHQVEIRLDLRSGDRFLAKLALGFGAVFLDEAFVTSPDAKRLRDFLWERDPERRGSLDVHGAGFFDAAALPIADVLAWEPGHLFVLQPLGNRLGLGCLLFGSRSATIVVSTERAQWVERIHEEGSAFLVAPGIRSGFGLASLASYIAVRIGEDGGDEDALRMFMTEAERRKELPPFHLPPPA